METIIFEEEKQIIKEFLIKIWLAWMKQTEWLSTFDFCKSSEGEDDVNLCAAMPWFVDVIIWHSSFCRWRCTLSSFSSLRIRKILIFVFLIASVLSLSSSYRSPFASAYSRFNLLKLSTYGRKDFQDCWMSFMFLFDAAISIGCRCVNMLFPVLLLNVFWSLLLKFKYKYLVFGW